MSENKFIARLKGEPTPKSVVEIQNDRLVAPFKSSPMGHIADRDSSVVVAKGAQNWAVNQGQLVPVADDYVGTESDLTATSRVSGAGLWLNATYTFPATGDETNPVSAIIAPSAKWVLTLCGDSLITQNGSVITLTMLVKIGATHLTTKQFKIRECASQFSQRLAIDFSESEQKVIKAHGGSPLTVQVLCDDEGASATIYSGMTHLTLLQRKIDADLVATDNVLLPEFIENLLEGYIIPADYFSRYDYIEQVEDGGSAFPQFTRSGDDMNFSGWLDISSIKNDLDELGDQVSGIEEKIPGDASATNQLATKADLKDIDLDGYVKKSGDTMTGGLVFDVVNRADIIFQDSFVDTAGNTNSVKKIITAPHQTQGFIFSEIKNGVNQMQFSMVIDGFFMPHGNRLLGNADYPWENIYAKKLNNGADIAIPTEGGTLARIEDLIDLRADINEADSELQTQITAQAAEIATKQDQLTAGDNIVISGNVISATGTGGVGFDMQVVDQLPATGKKGVIYLVPKDGTAPDVHDEYVWIDATQTFELIGNTQVDLTDYVKNTDYAGQDKAGVIKTSSGLGMATSTTGYILAATATKPQYDSANTTYFIGKGTLENIKNDLVKRAVTTNDITLTDEEKAAARTWIGAISDTDYAGIDGSPGTIRVSSTYGTQMVTSGYLRAGADTLETYKTRGVNSFIGKGTLENIKYDLVKQGITANTIALTDDEKAAAQAWLGVSGGGASGLESVATDRTLQGDGRSDAPLGLSSETITRFEEIEKVIPGTANEDNKLCTYEEMQENVQVVSDELTGLRESIQTKDLTVGTSEGTLNLSITAGVATIATNNGLDIVSQTKFDTAPTTDDTTTWANANDTSLVTKRQVATALSESGDCGLIIRRL